MKNRIKIIFIFFAIILISSRLCSKENNFYFYPKVMNQWDINYNVGLSLTYLPTAVVEEEINSSPFLNFGVKLAFSKNSFARLDMGSNYLANIGTLGYFYNFINNDISLGVGLRTSIWFGHLNFSAFNIKSTGGIIAPEVHAGFSIGDLKISSAVELESNYIYTTSDDQYLGESFQKFSGLTFKFSVEQPLWKEHWVSTSLKLNYNKFYYQSWISFSTVDEYLLYPEFSFGFTL
jgi:hypothetical protein